MDQLKVQFKDDVYYSDKIKFSENPTGRSQ